MGQFDCLPGRFATLWAVAVVGIATSLGACATDGGKTRADTRVAELGSAGGEAPSAGELEKARVEKRLRDRVAKKPDDPRPYIELARFLLEENRAAEAAAALDPWIADHPDFAAAWRAKAAILEAGGLEDEAVAVLEQAAAACPDDPEIFSALSRMYLSREKLQPALGAAEVASSLDAENPLYHLQVLDLYALLGDLDAMHRAVNSAVANRPDMAPLFYMREAEWFDKAGRANDALASVERALAMDPNHVPAVLQKAALLNDVERYEDAMNLLVATLDRHPEDRRLIMILAATTALFAHQQDAEGKARIRKDPKDVDGYLMVARAHVIRGDGDKGLAVLTEGVIENPRAAPLWLMIGALELRASREAEALSAYRRAIRLDAKNSTARNNMAYLLVTASDRALRNTEEAMAHVRVALRAEPDNPAFLDTLAEIHFKRGERRLALSVIRRAIELAPRDDFFRNQLQRFEKDDPKSSEPSR
jgi:tetratricopeptide (TPR) repeat protein